MKIEKPEIALSRNLEGALRLDLEIVKVYNLYASRNILPDDKFFTSNPAEEVFKEYYAQPGNGKYGAHKLFIKLNRIVINDAMEITYQKIRREGMPWLWGNGEYSKSLMTTHLRQVVDKSMQRHAASSFPEQLDAELEFLEKLRNLGEMRRKDVSGKNYASMLAM